MNKEQRQIVFANLVKEILTEMNSEVMAVGYLMRQWLESSIVNAGTSVDQGAGLGQFDLWAEVGNRELFITIRAGRLLEDKPNEGEAE